MSSHIALATISFSGKKIRVEMGKENVEILGTHETVIKCPPPHLPGNHKVGLEWVMPLRSQHPGGGGGDAVNKTEVCLGQSSAPTSHLCHYL